MQYLGGKSRLAKRFAPILDAALVSLDGQFAEPFVGGFNVLPALRCVRTALCTDVHRGLIGMYQAYQDGWRPPEHVSRGEYVEANVARDGSPRSTFISFACAFGGKEWGGFARNDKGQDFAQGGLRSLARKFKALPPVRFRVFDYGNIPTLRPAVWYCDPPYVGTTGYKTGDFDHVRFYAWAENLARLGSAVFVSEFTAPAHWEIVWSHTRKIQVGTTARKIKIDRLYRVVPRRF